MPECQVCFGTGRTTFNREQFKHWTTNYLVEAAPDILWVYVEDVGDYQGTIYAVGRYKGQIVLYVDYYGSCSGCGGWGEGGEPTSQEEIFDKSVLFGKTYVADAIEYAEKKFTDSWSGGPSMSDIRKAIHEAGGLQFG